MTKAIEENEGAIRPIQVNWNKDLWKSRKR